VIRLGQHPVPTHTIAHFSDPHLLGGGRRLYGTVNTSEHLAEALAQLEQSRLAPDAIVFTGDLADLGEPDAYDRLRELVEPVARRMGSEVIWVMGNHDERAPYAKHLFADEGPDGTGATSPQDRVHEVRGLRIISLDTSVPGYHHGELEPSQLQWLRDVLATPTEHGTIIAVHHPPIPTPLNEPMAILELDDQPAFADVIRGTDVRGILGGHLHYSCHSTFAGVPVSVASATCYVMDLTDPETIIAGVDVNQSVDIVSAYPDRLVHTTVPVGQWSHVSGQPAAMFQQVIDMPRHLQRELFSKKTSEYNADEEARSER
jgi:3',5'-cyclic AMP phosphodiesterase CpdA